MKKTLLIIHGNTEFTDEVQDCVIDGNRIRGQHPSGSVCCWDFSDSSWYLRLDEAVVPSAFNTVDRSRFERVAIWFDGKKFIESEAQHLDFKPDGVICSLPSTKTEIRWGSSAKPTIIHTSAEPAPGASGLVEPGKSTPLPTLSADVSGDVREARAAFQKRTGQSVSFAAVVAEARKDYDKEKANFVSVREADLVGFRLAACGIEFTEDQLAAALK